MATVDKIERGVVEQVKLKTEKEGQGENSETHKQDIKKDIQRDFIDLFGADF